MHRRYRIRLPFYRRLSTSAATLALAIGLLGLVAPAASAAPTVCSYSGTTATITMGLTSFRDLTLKLLSGSGLEKRLEVRVSPSTTLTCTGYTSGTSVVNVTGTTGNDRLTIDMDGTGGTFEGLLTTFDGLGGTADSITFLGRPNNDNVVLLYAGDGSPWDNHALLSAASGQDVSLDNVEAASIVGGSGGDLLGSARPWWDTYDHPTVPMTIDAGAGDDVINGGAADDTFLGGSGADQIRGYGGMGGNDTLSYADSSVGIELPLDPSPGGVGVGGDAEGDIVSGVGIVFGSDHDDLITGLGMASYTLVGGEGDDTLLGGGSVDDLSGDAGNDILEGGGSADSLDGGSGNDTATYENASARVVANLTTGSGTVGDADGDLFYGIENLTGSDHDDDLFGDANANILDGLDGVNAMNGYAGNDVLITGDESEGGNSLLIGGDGSDQITSGSGNDSIYGDDTDAESVFTGNDVIHSGAGPDTVYGGRGNDQIYGEAGSDTLGGGYGDDLVDGGANDDDLWGDAGNDVLSGGDDTDDIWGGTGNDEVRGGDANDVLAGEDGNDSIYGDAGDDTMYGGAGDDVIEGGASATTSYCGDTMNGDDGSDTLSYASSPDGVIAPVDSYLSGGDADGDCQSNFENVTGSEFDDELYGDAGVNVLRGLGGDDLIKGGDGNDTLYGGAGDDEVWGEVGIDTVYGDAGLDVLLGGAGTDSLSGGDDDDSLEGGTSGDTLNGGNGNDVASYATSSSAVTIRLGVSQSGGDAAGDTFTSIEGAIGSAGNDTLIGDGSANVLSGLAGTDTIVGNGGNDTLSGGDGNDTLYGGAGNDSFSGGLGVDRVSYNEGAQAGAASGAITFSLWSCYAQATGGAGSDTLACSGPGGVNDIEQLEGSNTWGDTLSGDNLANSIWGLGGNDILDGNPGNDLLYGGLGNDTLRYSSSNGGNDTLNGQDGTGDVCQGYLLKKKGPGKVTYVSCELSLAW